MTSHRRAPTSHDELQADRRRERLLLWKGILALAVVVAVVVVRQLYLV